MRALCTGGSNKQLSVPVENEILDLRAVPMATLNPRRRREGADLSELLGLDEGTLRRSVVADLGKVEIPEDQRTRGDALLDRARELGPAEMPAPRYPDWNPTEEVQARLLAAFDSRERLGDVDVSMVALLCTALSAWLEKEDALRAGVDAYLTVVETLGWTRVDWREALAPVDAPAAPAAPAPEPKEANPLDYTAKALRIHGVLGRLGLDPEVAADLLERLEIISIDRLEALDILDSAVRETGLSVEELLKMSGAAGAFAEILRIPGGRVPDLVVGVLRVLSRELGGVPDKARLREIAEAVGKDLAAWAEARTEAAALPALREEREMLDEELFHLQIAVLDHKRRIALAREVSHVLTGALNPHGPLATQILQTRQTRRGRRLVPLSPDAAKEVFNLLFRACQPQLVGRWEIAALWRKNRQEAVQRLHAEYSALRDALADPALSLEEKERRIADGVARLTFSLACPA